MASYPTDLHDHDWERLEPLFDPAALGRPRRGRPPMYPRQWMVEAILYIGRTGCPWRYLPADFPPWGAV